MYCRKLKKASELLQLDWLNPTREGSQSRLLHWIFYTSMETILGYSTPYKIFQDILHQHAKYPRTFYTRKQNTLGHSTPAYKISYDILHPQAKYPRTFHNYKISQDILHASKIAQIFYTRMQKTRTFYTHIQNILHPHAKYPRTFYTDKQNTLGHYTHLQNILEYSTPACKISQDILHACKIS